MSKIKIASININGLRNKCKRKVFFSNMRKSNFDILCIQESFIGENEGSVWEKEWGGQLFFSSESRNSMGQIILIRKNFAYPVECVHKSKRILTVRVKLDSDDLYVTNVYSPNVSADKRSFFKTLTDHIESLNALHQVVCGDMNCVLDNSKDIINGEKHSVGDVKAFCNFVSRIQLNDAWRMFNNDKREFTWSRKNPFLARRLDYMLVSESVFNKSQDCTIESMAQSDHRLVSFVFMTSNATRGPSYWKFNDSLINDSIFVKELNELIENFENNDYEPQIKWDLCKLKIKEFCIQYGKKKSMLRRNLHQELLVQLNEVDNTLANDPFNKDLVSRREAIRLELELYEANNAKGAQTRSRMKFIEDGEKNTKYFLNLEKVRSNSKILDSVRLSNGNIVSDQGEIIKEIVSFFGNRYKKKIQFDRKYVEEFIKDVEIPQLSVNEKEETDKPLSEAELINALKALNNASAPGLDGLTSTFLKFFWHKIKKMLLDSLNTAFRVGELSHSQKIAVITLIHKGKQLSRDDLNNWRPISLTNADYKLMAKALAFRLSGVIQNLVSEDQVGFMKGRNSSYHVRLIDDIIDYLKQKNKPGILFALDYKAAFDTISKEFIAYAFKKFNFGDYYVRWIEIMMNNTLSCVNYMGWVTESFEIESGIRQGCPLSPMTFILALELLALKIRSDLNIKGINLPDDLNNEQFSVVKLLLYADDLTLFVQDKQDLKNALTLVSYFSKFSGLAMNHNKSEAMWLGSKINCNEGGCDVNWKSSVKILGVHFQNNMCASNIETNWLPRVDKIKCIIQSWYKRNLSIMGKICLVKSLLISQLTYVMQALVIPMHILQQINTILFRFIWKKRYSNTKAFEKVKRKIMCKDTEQGGLNMINIVDMQNSFLLAWANKLRSKQNCKWKQIPMTVFSTLGHNLACFSSNVEVKRFKGIGSVTNVFWKQVLQCYLEQFQVENARATHLKPVEYQIIWNNDCIQFKRNTLFIKDWIKAGICLVKDVLNDDKTVLPFDVICQKVGYKPTRRFEYGAVTSAIYALFGKYEPIKDAEGYSILEATVPRILRKYLIDRDKVLPVSTQFWLHNFNIEIEKENWMCAKDCTKETRLRLLHWKVLHNIYPTNILLNKIGYANSNKCQFCNVIDYPEHFFYECRKIKKIWKIVENKIYLKFDMVAKIGVTDVLLGIGKRQGLCTEIKMYCNLLIIIAKMCIGIVRYGTPLEIEILFNKELLIRHID